MPSPVRPAHLERPGLEHGDPGQRDRPPQTSKQLSFTLGTSGTADLQGTYYTDCTIAGAFTAKVHYTLNTWPSANGVRVGLLVNNPDYPFPSGSVTAERTSFAASGDVSTGEKYVSNGTDSGGGFVTKRDLGDVGRPARPRQGRQLPHGVPRRDDRRRPGS